MKSLVVDDVEINREMLAVFLTGHGTTETAEHGEEALEKIETAMDSGGHYDLICLDINMPGINGHETLRRIRELEERRGCNRATVFMVTASSSPDDMMDALMHGACDDFVTKPLIQKNFEKLLQRHGLAA